MSVTIPGELLKRVQEGYRELYLQEFGPDALSPHLVPLCKDQVADVYARNVRFWRRHTPATIGTLEDAARHAVCSNAEEQLLRRVRELGAEDLVTQLLC
jgi:hypothetical protein